MCKPSLVCVCLFYQAKAPRSVVLIVGTHLDEIEPSQQTQLVNRYHQLIVQSFTNHRDLPYFWPQIKSIHFVGLIPRSTRDMYVDELRYCIYDTALDMEQPMGQ